MELQQDTVFVTGLPEDVNEDSLAGHFGSIGVIKVGFPQFQISSLKELSRSLDICSIVITLTFND